jgi:hypothetical protein
LAFALTRITLIILDSSPYLLFEDHSLYDSGKTILYYTYKEGLYICPSTLKEIRPFAFKGNFGSNITFSFGTSALERIGESAFAGLELQGEFIIPASLNYIAPNALANLRQVFYLDVATNNTSFTMLDGVLYNASLTECIFAGPLMGNDIILPSSVLTIAKRAFANKDNLQSILINEGVEVIEEYTFAGSSNLRTVVLPDSLITIGVAAFQGTNLENISFGNSLERIEESAFNVTNIHDVVLPSSMRYIGHRAFASIGVTNFLTLNEGLETIDSLAFASSHLETLDIPSTVSDLSIDAFGDTSSYLTTINIHPDSEYYEYMDAFLVNKEHTKLFWVKPNTDFEGTLTLPVELQQIAGYAFRGNKTFTEVNYLPVLEVVGRLAFSQTNLTSFTLPPTTTFVGNDAFGDSKLATVVILAPHPFISYTAFINAPLVNMTISGDMQDDIMGFYSSTVKHLVIADGTSEINRTLFSIYSVRPTSLTIPLSLMTITPNIFNSYPAVKESLTTIIFLGTREQLSSKSYAQLLHTTFTKATITCTDGEYEAS